MSEQMRAWQVTGAGEPIDVLEEVEVPRPVPGPGQVRIRVSASGIGLPDVLMCRGTYPLTPPLPFTPGQELTGVITGIGEGVTAVAVGERVMAVSTFYLGNGSFAEECLALESTVFPVPERLTDVEAAGWWIPNHTAWIGLVERGHLAVDERLVVLGAAGGSGAAALQLGVALDARTIAVVSDEAKAAFCRELGAEAVVVRGPDAEGSLADALRATTDGTGVDVIYDPVGGEQAEDAAGALRRGGRLLAIGFASGRWPTIDTHQLVLTSSSVVGVFAGDRTPDELAAIHADLSALVASGRLRNVVTATPPFADLPEALQRLADRKVVGKLVLVP
jgi:NADPH2:quinone reductase